MSSIAPISGISIGAVTGPSLTSPATAGEGFGTALKSAIQTVSNSQQSANQSIEGFLQGNGELHNVALATQRAEMTFDLAMQVRNKVVSAYQEVMKMQL
jgi:flagellar hook-basal body complex protein FliE